MIMEQTMVYLNTEYRILSVEQEFIVHPAAFGFLPLSAASLQCPFTSNLQVKEYQLLIDKLNVGNCEAVNFGGTRLEGYAQQHEFNEIPVSYHGAILIGADLVKEYYIKGNIPTCFSYQKVYELIFEEGSLITTVDQSKAMLRIRKNLELGFRSLSKRRDVRCILRFMNSSFVGDYKPFRLNYNRMNYVKEMKNVTIQTPTSNVSNSLY